MASRLRGMANLSSTIIPRVQRLLDTGVLKERPLWLDAVEALPPLQPPSLPEEQKTGKSLTIFYPQDKKRELQDSLKLHNGKRHGHGPPVCLFESRAIKTITQWARPIVAADLLSTSTAEEISQADEASETESLRLSDVDNEGVLSVNQGVQSSIEQGADTENMQSSDITSPLESRSVHPSVPDMESKLPDSKTPLSEGSSCLSERVSDASVQQSDDKSKSSKSGIRDEQPTITVYVQQEASSGFEDTVSELSKLLKKYEE